MQRSGYTWNRPVMMVWISIDVKSPKVFKLSLPIPLFIIMGIIDTLDDMFCLIKFFKIGENLKIKSKTGGINIPLRYWRLATIAAKTMLDEIIWHTGPLDLVDIAVGGRGEHTEVRISLR